MHVALDQISQMYECETLLDWIKIFIPDVRIIHIHTDLNLQ